MLELTFLILVKRITDLGRAPVVATRGIAADVSTLFRLASDPASQWRIIDGISRLLRPHAVVQPSDSKRLIFVRLYFGRRNILSITWMLSPRGGTTDARLSAELRSRSLLARLALMLGGRRWLQQHLEHILVALATLSHAESEDIHDTDIMLPLSPPSPAPAGPVAATPVRSLDG
jgi:hypothetical protein